MRPCHSSSRVCTRSGIAGSRANCVLNAVRDPPVYPDSAAASSSCDPPPSSAHFVSSQWQVAGVCAGCPLRCWLQSSRGGGGRRCPWSREQALRRTPPCGLPAGPLSLDLSGWFCGPQAGALAPTAMRLGGGAGKRCWALVVRGVGFLKVVCAGLTGNAGF